jgi:dTDP-4-amino-4,6-dideoxygalactose transaminase
MKPSIHAWHLFPIGVGIKQRDAAIQILGKNGIGTTVNYNSIPTLHYYKNKYNLNPKVYPESYKWGMETLSLPLYTNLTFEEQKYVIDVVLNEILPKLESET